jgi:hypothetical protein
MTQAFVLGQRALREGIRTPEAILPTLFIPLFFLVVNVGQVAKIFPGSTTEFLHGQGYGAFQLPTSVLLAASFGSAALFLVEEIEGGYFDKLRATPVRRSAIVLGRLFAEGVKGLAVDREPSRSSRPCLRDQDRERTARLHPARRTDRCVGSRVLRLHADRRAQDAKRRCRQLSRPYLSFRSCS